MAFSKHQPRLLPDESIADPYSGRVALCWLAACLLGLCALACASDRPPLPEAAEATAEVTPETNDPALRARRAGVEAAQAREKSARMLDEMEIRVGDEYLDEHQVRVTARLPLLRPAEVQAQREVYAAETEMAESRFDEASLSQQSELCFPSVETGVRAADLEIYRDYAGRQESLLAYNDEGQKSGMISELDGSRFELASRLRLATREPLPAASRSEQTSSALPSLDAPAAPLVLSEPTVREAVRRHHPSVALRRATAVRYEALAARARSRKRPWIKFVDLSYEHRSGKEGKSGSADGPTRNGGGGRLAFTIPFGGSQQANVRRYDALVREQRGEADALVEEQGWRAMLALQTLHDFEQRAGRLRELLVLAESAEAIADRWWKSKLARPSQVAALLDEAFATRSAVLEAREDAGIARCTLLAMTGVAAEDWPREALAEASPVRD